MQAVKSSDTTPEFSVRRFLHAAGYRYRLHVKTLPGSPDIVFPSQKKAIFVHGCFWHGHNCPKGRLPKSRPEYWQPKIAGNRRRDRRQTAALKALGWQVAVAWQCQTIKPARLLKRLLRFLER